MESRLGKGGSIAAVAAVTGGGCAVATDDGVEVAEPVADCQWCLIDPLLQEVVLGQHQKEVHLLEGGVSDDALKETPTLEHLVPGQPG